MAIRRPKVKVGTNPRSTPYKQAALDGNLGGFLVGSTAVIAEKLRKLYHLDAPAIIFDLTCGPGYDDAGNEGSPLIFAKKIVAQIERGRPISLRCADAYAKHLANLRNVMAELYPQLPVRYFSDQREALIDVPRDAVGLAYFDPTAYTDLDVDLLREMGQRFRRVDILLTRECGAARRMLGARHTRDWTLTIKDYIEAPGKVCTYWGQYATRSWWSFAFASNWVRRDEKDLCWRDEKSGLRAGRLVRADSEEGRRELARWTGDKAWNQPPLLGSE